jgi:hypothetical protein
MAVPNAPMTVESAIEVRIDVPRDRILECHTTEPSI